ncbi:MAG: aspartate 1-decarboxylase [Planctomycetota bacterium]
MQRCMMLAKVHRAVVSDTNADYEGSITIPPEVVEASGFAPGERVTVANIANAARFETYVMVGTEPAHFRLNGAAAKLGSPGDRIIMFTFAWMDAEEAARHRPRVVHMDEANRIVRVEGPEA